MKSKNDSLNQKSVMHYKRENLNLKTATSDKKYNTDSKTSETSNDNKRESSPWDLQLRNGKTDIAFEGTQNKAKQNEPVNYPNNQFACSDSENVKKDNCLKEIANVKFSSPKHINGDIPNSEISDVNKKQNTYFSRKDIHEYPYNTDIKSHRQMQSSLELNYLSLDDKVGSPWHRNLVNVKTKSNI